MNWNKEFSNDKILQTELAAFYNKYGISGIKQAIALYTTMHQEYICNTKTTTSKISIGEIYYLEIREHNISVYTQHGTYHKYGTLCKELEFLAPYGFLKCNQSCVVSLKKIKTIAHDEITLTNGSKLHMSRHYTRKLLLEFSKKDSLPLS